MNKAYFAAGCFWGVEKYFSQIVGVVETIVGYSGGRTDNPTYEEVCSDTTGHAETIEVEFDPNQIAYEQLVEHFFECHDPTTLNRQGPDNGSQYRSAIFYCDEDQKNTAQQVKSKLDKSGKFANPIVTEITEFDCFYHAEDYHQKYFKNKTTGLF